MASTRTNKITVPKTGQTTSYSDYDDGYYEKGSPISPRFIDNGDGTISDRVTSLMWVKNTVLIIPGTTGVTTNNQILVAKGNWAVNSAYIKGDLAKDTIGSTYWACCADHTSSALKVSGTLNPDATGLYAVYGSKNSQTRYKHVSASWYIWWRPQGGMFDEWVICNDPDTASGTFWHAPDLAPPAGLLGGYGPLGGATGTATVALATLFSEDRTALPTYWRQTIWTNSASDLVSRPDSTWQEAIDRCEALEYAGYSDWRLPNTKELLSLDDYSKNNPSVDDDYFTDLVTDDANEYWSSTTDSANTPNSLNAEYYGGGIISDSKDGEFLTVYTRPVRGGRN